MTQCSTPKADGSPCRARVRKGRAVCRFHSGDPEDVALLAAQSASGGHAKNGTLPDIHWAGMLLADDPAVTRADFTTAAGCRDLLAATLRMLTHQPLSTKTTFAIGHLVGTQARLIEQTDIESRLAALESPSWST